MQGVSGGKKCLFFRNFGVPCYLETLVLRIAFLPYSRRIIHETFVDTLTTFSYCGLPISFFLNCKRAIFFSIWVFFHEHSRNTGQLGIGKAIFLSLHFHPLHRHLDINRVITSESSPLHIASARREPATVGFRAKVTNH